MYHNVFILGMFTKEECLGKHCFSFSSLCFCFREQKRQLELKLQQLTYDQHKMQLAQRVGGPQNQQAVSAAQSQSHTIPASTQPDSVPLSMNQNVGQVPLQQTNGFIPSQTLATQHVPLPAPSVQQTTQPGQDSLTLPAGQCQIPSHTEAPPAQPVTLPGTHQPLGSSLSSSGMSQNPMNSIPPTHTTGTMPLMTSQGQGYHRQGQPVRSAYQPPSAVLTTDQLTAPYPSSHASIPNGHLPVAQQPQLPVSAVGQSQPTVSPGHVPPSSLTNEGMSEQMRKVKQYQEYLLARHKQSQKVLEETKAEIKRRRENLLQRYPNLDLSKLEDMGAKYLESQSGLSKPQQPASTEVPKTNSQGPPSSVAALLASLAAHPYYASSLSQADGSFPQPADRTSAISTVGAAEMNGTQSQAHPAINAETNLRKNKFENVRKSLPFDADESLRIHDSYVPKSLDTTTATDITETDTSTLTEKGSPALKPAPKPAPRAMQPGSREVRRDVDKVSTDESGMDTTASESFLSERDDPAAIRQEELRKQLAEIQRQKEEIIQRHQVFYL